MSGRRSPPLPHPADPDDDGDDDGLDAADAGDGAGDPPALRLDKWLWQARFFKTRSLAAKLCTAGGVEVEGHAGAKPHLQLRPGMVLRFVQGGRIRVIRVEATGTRRGPAPEAQRLYTDLSPPPLRSAEPAIPAAGSRDPGAGRPTKRDRRAIARLQGDG